MQRSSFVNWLGWYAVGALLALVALFLLYQLPPVKFRLEWRLDYANGVVRGWLYPGDTLPAPGAPTGGAIGVVNVPTALPTLTPLPTSETPEIPTPTPAASPTPLPAQVTLYTPEWEKQDWNNCGPATLALALKFHGWEGDQFDISDLLKPERGDKNVNIEELVFYVRNRAGWLNADFRVDGDIDTLKRFLAEGIPVVVEKGFVLDPSDGGGGWAGHYLLLTGYDDEQGIFIAQDTNPGTGGPDRRVRYESLDQDWKAFNRVYMYLYPPSQQATVEEILGENLDADVNRQQALETARAEIEADPNDPYAWFNLGSNLVYFERYGEAVEAFDNALSIGLPWRFTRYQFGPYIAYFHQGRFDELIELADATLYRTYKAEESLLWRGWASYRLGDLPAALDDWWFAIELNPNYVDARYALEFVGALP